MIRHSSAIIATAMLLTLSTPAALAQDVAAAGGAGSDEDESNVAYYVVDDPLGLWPSEAEPEPGPEDPDREHEPEPDTPPQDQDEPAVVREPPGLPMLVAVRQGDSPENSDETPPSGAFGGTAVADATAPWQAQIYYPGTARSWAPMLNAGVKPWVLQHYCGGVLIATNWVVTAAHCIDQGMMQVGYRVRLGAERIDGSSGWSYKIDRVIRYPSYRPLKGGDIALIRIVNDQGLRPPVSQVRPIGIFRGVDPAPNERVTAFGWGRTSDNSAAANSVLLQVSLKIVDRTTCTGERISVIDERVVCAGAPDRKTCSNDSGGPLINFSRQLVGIVSAGGRSCKADGKPGVYTRVGAYLPWITEQTGGAVR